MGLTEINQKLDKILEFQEKQEKYARIKFWVNLVIIFVFIILPLIFLPIVISQVLDIYSGVLNPETLQDSTEQAQGLLKLFE